MHSSYSINRYDAVFKAIVSAYQPIVCVELGVLEGYSTVAIAQGLRENFEKNGSRGHLDAYDLFDQYPYRHTCIKTAQENIDKSDLGEWVTLEEKDALLVAGKYGDGAVHFLHVDLSNTGEIVRKVMQKWDRCMCLGGVICFEGGSEERDQVEWMKKFNAEPLKPEFESNPIVTANYVFGTYFKFPGLTCLLKKR